MNNTKITLFNLMHFMPLNNIEAELYKFDQTVINRFINNLEIDNFYLGGELYMKYNDLINVDIINKVRASLIEKYRNDSYSNEMVQSHLFDAHKEMDFIENMIESYTIVMKIRFRNKTFK